jgi:hypothetical protein
MDSDIVFKLNRGKNNGGGFFCLLFFLCNAYLRAKQIGAKFYIQNVNWPHNEWHDYFTSLEVAPLTCKDPVYCAHMEFDPSWVYTIREYREAIREIFVLKDRLHTTVSDILRTLPPNYVAIFVRRGDKWLEVRTPLTTQEILKRIRYDASTVFFVQTDDYTVVEEFRSLVPNRIVSTVPATKRGSYHSIQFKQWCGRKDVQSIEEKSSDVMAAETDEMLVGLQVCALADECWTDTSSNTGRFLKLYGKNVHTYPEEVVVDENSTRHPAWGL